MVVVEPNFAFLRTEFERALPEGSLVRRPDPGDPAAVEAALADADVLVSGRRTPAMAAAAPRLRLAHASGAGTDGIDIDALAPGVQVANTFHHEDSIAEYAVSAAIMLRRGFPRQHAALREGRWDSPSYDPGAPWVDTLATATVGFVGFGHIGARCWQRFRAFGARGTAVTRRGEVDAAAQGLARSETIDGLEPLLESSDVVVVSAPLTPGTKGLIGAAELARLGPSGAHRSARRGRTAPQHRGGGPMTTAGTAAAANAGTNTGTGTSPGTDTGVDTGTGADTIVAAEVLVTSPGRNFVALKITTAQGLVGWGDATLNGRELAVASYLRDHLAPLLIGRDPARIEDTWQYLYRGAYWRRGPVTMTAIGAVDIALWDIKGKATGQPVYQLLGGAVRDRILTYTHATGWDVPHLLDSVDARRAEGFLAIRAQSGVPGLDTVYGVTRDGVGYEPAGRGAAPAEEVWDTESYLRHAPKVLAAVRDHVGPEVMLLHDAHHRLTPGQAAGLGRALEEVDLFWLEDVTPAENQEVLRHVRRHTTVPLAIGEVFNTVWECQSLITEQLIDFVRTCVTHAGGISHLRRIAALAEIWQVRLGPHGPSDVSPVALGASLHVGLSTPNFAIQEYMGYEPLVHEVFRHAWSYAEGHLHPGDRPGIGIEVDEKLAARFPYEPAYLPVARRRDGSMTDW